MYKHNGVVKDIGTAVDPPDHLRAYRRLAIAVIHRAMRESRSNFEARRWLEGRSASFKMWATVAGLQPQHRRRLAAWAKAGGRGRLARERRQRGRRRRDAA